MSDQMPARLWVQTGPHGAWCEHRVEGDDVEYVRADLALPRPWRTAAELEELPEGSIVRDRNNDVYLRRDLRRPFECLTGLCVLYRAAEVARHAPGLILYVPKEVASE